MGPGDLIEAVICGTTSLQKWCNVYHFVVDVAPTVVDWAVITSKYVSDIVQLMRPLMHEDTSIDEISFFSVEDGDPLHSEAINLKGSVPTDGTAGEEPPFVALGYRLGTVNGKTRDGAKRFAGTSERMFDKNTVAAAYMPAVNGLGEAITSAVAAATPAANAFSFFPVIVGRDEDGKLDVTRYDLVSGWTDAKPTTQNSRKVK